MKLQEKIIDHYKEQRNMDNSYYSSLDKGPMKDVNPEFTILIIPPNKKRDMWTYATVGMSSLDTAMPIELHVFSNEKNDRLIEILTAIAYYQLEGKILKLDDTVNFGIPLQFNSDCDHGLISLPYLDGEGLEKLHINSHIVSFFWLIPITKEERDYRWKYGIDSLEEIFEKKGLNYLDLYRKSVV